MNVDYCIAQLEGNARAIEALVAPVDDAQARWKPAPRDWSVLEVLCHLLDEEREDFRARLQHLLSGSDQPWAPIDPQGWVTSRGYNQRDLQETVAQYLAERQASLAWLRSLGQVSWELRYAHPPLQELTAGALLAAWAAHDLLHLRQLVELKWAYGLRQTVPYSPAYAGDW